jgi:hypothetical protein
LAAYFQRSFETTTVTTDFGSARPPHLRGYLHLSGSRHATDWVDIGAGA